MFGQGDLTWTEKDEDENYVARHEFGFVQAGDKFVMFGGRESAQVLDVYDYTSNTWSHGGVAPVEFNHFQAVLYEGLIWVIGAFKDNFWEYNADYVYMYNPVTEEWIQGMEIPESRKRGANGTVMYNGKFYMVGGNTMGHEGGYVSYFDEFDPETGIWTPLANAPHQRDHIQAAMYGNKLYALGGRLSGGEGGIFGPMVPEVDVYDFLTSSWSTLNNSSNIPTPRAGYGVALFQDEIYVIGGEGLIEGTTMNPQWSTVEAFDPLTNTWETKDNLNYSRHGIQAIVSGNGIFVAGGSSSGISMKNMEYYGEDNPVGSPLANSTFSADELNKEFTYSEEDTDVVIEINLSNTSGDTGTYVDSVVLDGANFSLAQSYDNRFLKSNSSLSIQVELLDTSVLESNGTVTITYNNTHQIVVTLHGEQDGTLSTPSIEETSSMKLFPNPVANEFSVNAELESLTIYDTSGKLIEEFHETVRDFHFDISSLKTGLYFVKMKSYQKECSTHKLIKI